MRMGKSSRQKHGKCIFCGSGGLSKQHVIPDWMSDVVPVVQDGYEQNAMATNSIVNRTLKSSVIVPDIRSMKRNGNPAQRTIRNVCIECNGGWISVVESKAKPYLERMIRGENISLTEQEQECVALALVIITVMNEYTDPLPTNIMIPNSQLNYIRNHLTIPDGWWISVGVMKNAEAPKSRHHNCRFVERYLRSGQLEERSQVTTVVLGHLIFQSVTFINLIFPFDWSDNNWLRIWPSKGSINNWRYNLASIENEKYSNIANELAELIKEDMSIRALAPQMDIR